MGFLPPAIHICDNLDLKPTAYRILLNGVEITSGEVHPERWMAIDPGCAEGELEGVHGRDPAFQLPAIWIDEEFVISRSAKMQSIIAFISTLQFLNTVKLDHMIWKLQVYQLLLDKEADYRVNTHTDCRLGKWYNKGEGKHFAHLEAYRQLEQPHAEVHASGRTALEAFFNQDSAGMEAASHRVVRLVDELATSITF